MSSDTNLERLNNSQMTGVRFKANQKTRSSVGLFFLVAFKENGKQATNKRDSQQQIRISIH